MTFPFALSETGLVAEDFERFSLLFSQAVAAYIPCEAVHFFPEVTTDDRHIPGTWRESLAKVHTTQKPVAVSSAKIKSICLPILNNGALAAVAVLEGVAQKTSVKQSKEQVAPISRVLRDMKERYLDAITGLPNNAALQAEMEAHLFAAVENRDEQGHEATDSAVLALLEIYPQARDAERALAAIHKASLYLQSLFGAGSPLYHVGSGVFALLWFGVSLGEARKMGDVLLRRLRREEFSKAQIGMTSLDLNGKPGYEPVTTFLDQAWQALRVARRRGPFGLCAHATEAELDSHPLRPLSQGAMRQLASLWRGKEKFSLVLLCQDQQAVSNHFAKRVRAAINGARPCLFLNQREAYVFLDKMSEKQAMNWARRFRKKMRTSAGSTFSMGIAGYPCLKYKKTQVAFNCRKSLLHAGFYGPDSTAPFNAVTLNISGDLSFNEGDLAKAVREYRQGLELDPDNVNLLNSLGVSYVQLKRSKMARASFEKALRKEPKNFMALFNLGFVSLRQGDIKTALDYFERALAVDDKHFDLLLQLGKLYCGRGQYREAARVLKKAVKRLAAGTGRNGEGAAVSRLLGLALAGLGKKREAMVSFQQALAVNSRDALALSMLGELYARTKQGDDIALSLCKQAVALDDTQSGHWQRLGWVQHRTGDPEAAAQSLEQCLRLDRKAGEAAFLLGRIYQGQGKRTRARRMYERVLRIRPGHEGARQALDAM